MFGLLLGGYLLASLLELELEPANILVKASMPVVARENKLIGAAVATAGSLSSTDGGGDVSCSFSSSITISFSTDPLFDEESSLFKSISAVAGSEAD